MFHLREGPEATPENQFLTMRNRSKIISYEPTKWTMTGLLGPSILDHLNQAITWAVDFPLRQFRPIARTIEELEADTPLKCKDVVEYFTWLSLGFMHEIFQDATFWKVPHVFGDELVLPHCDPDSGSQNLKDEVQDWRIFQDVPDMDDLGSKQTKDQFAAGKFKGNYQALLISLHAAHKGEVIEIPHRGEWQSVDGPIPLESRFFHQQYATTEEDAELLGFLGTKGSLDYQSRRPRTTAKAHGREFLDNCKPELQRIKALTTARFTDHAGWEGGYQARSTVVLTLPQVLFYAPENFTMYDAYLWYLGQPRIVKRRLPPGSVKRRPK
jgi:hypothetical protein